MCYESVSLALAYFPSSSLNRNFYLYKFRQIAFHVLLRVRAKNTEANVLLFVPSEILVNRVPKKRLSLFTKALSIDEI